MDVPPSTDLIEREVNDLSRHLIHAGWKIAHFQLQFQRIDRKVKFFVGARVIPMGTQLI
jgi:hypothetical protein